MGRKKAGLYAALVWLANHPDSTADEVARGIEFADSWRVFEWLCRAENEKMVRGRHKDGEMAIYWKVRSRDPDGPAARSSSGSDTSEHD